jgi:hypothetical protein
MHINQSHLRKLIPSNSDSSTKCNKDEPGKGWLGVSPKLWFSYIAKRSNIKNSVKNFVGSNLQLDKVNRDQLKSIVANAHIDTFTCCISILAWGGMNRRHGALLFSRFSDWEYVAEDIRKGRLTRSQAYQEFSKLRNSNKLPGMGPAYFTKLIFFLMPNEKNKGYIMDQWTSVSINLLLDEKVIHTSIQKTHNKNGKLKISERVLDSNSHIQYETFCLAVEYIANLHGVNPETIEQLMFSEGRGNGEWRNHVIGYRNSLLTTIS